MRILCIRQFDNGPTLVEVLAPSAAGARQLVINASEICRTIEYLETTETASPVHPSDDDDDED